MLVLTLIFTFIVFYLIRLLFIIEKERRILLKYKNIIDSIVYFFEDTNNQSKYSNELSIFINVISDFKTDIEKVKSKCDLLVDTFSNIVPDIVPDIKSNQRENKINKILK